MFIDFEGIDGSGKTTLSNALAERLEERGLKVTHARARGELRSAVARRVRPLTRDPQLFEMSARAEFFLNLARETQQIDEVVRPALARGEICITDRSLYSQLALAAGGRGLDEGQLRAAAELAGQGLWPDLVLLIDVDPDLAKMRKRAGKIRDGVVEEEPGRKGLSGHGLLVRVRAQFLRMAAAEPDRFVVVRNEGRALDTVVDEIVEVVTARLAGRAARTDAGLPRPAAPAPVRDLEQACFAAIDDLARTEPWVAVHLLTGVPGRAAHARRAGAGRSRRGGGEPAVGPGRGGDAPPRAALRAGSGSGPRGPRPQRFGRCLGASRAGPAARMAGAGPPRRGRARLRARLECTRARDPRRVPRSGGEESRGPGLRARRRDARVPLSAGAAGGAGQHARVGRSLRATRPRGAGCGGAEAGAALARRRRGGIRGRAARPA